MEQAVADYQSAIRHLLAQYESLETPYSKVEMLFDDDRQQYMAVRVGWREQTRIHACLIHIEIQDNIVIIQCNDTENPIASELVELGVPADKLRLGFLPPEHQEYARLTGKHLNHSSSDFALGPPLSSLQSDPVSSSEANNTIR